MTLSVVIGTLNRHDQIRACVESIFEQTTTPVRVYVTDAGSTDGTIEYLRSVASDELIPIFAGRRLGQARAYNEVFAEIDSPYVCWLSDDNVVVNHGLDVAVGILEANHRIGMVGLKVRDVRGPFVKAPYIGGVSEFGILNVNQGVLRTPILKAVGGFSAEFHDYGVDPDLTAKVLFSGHAVAYTREVTIHHYRNWSTDQASADYARLKEKQQRSVELYRRKYEGLAEAEWRRKARRLVWGLAQRLRGKAASLNSTRRFLGLLPRDWYNILMSRYVSVFDAVRYRGRTYHLVQYCPQRHRLGAKVSGPLVAGRLHSTDTSPV